MPRPDEDPSTQLYLVLDEMLLSWKAGGYDASKVEAGIAHLATLPDVPTWLIRTLQEWTEENV